MRPHALNNELVEAGAGSGKTTLFVNNYIKRLLSPFSIKPRQILALTFTKKAAAECTQRILSCCQTTHQDNAPIQALIPDILSAPIGTFHGFCSTLLKQHAHRIGLSPQYRVLSEDETHYIFNCEITSYLKDIIHTSSDTLLDYLRYNTVSRLTTDLQSILKSRYTLPHYLSHNPTLTECTHHLLALASPLIKRVESKLLEEHCIDYDGIIQKTDAILADTTLAKEIGSQFAYIMIDECQDTDPLQWRIIEQLCGSIDPLDAKKLFLVGDTKQCIYRFRGAKLSFFNDLRDRFDSHNESIISSLPNNYRSSPAILACINPLFEELFKMATPAIPFHSLIPQQQFPGSVSASFIKDSNDIQDEYRAIYNWVLSQQTSSTSICILARDRKTCDALFSLLKQHHLPVVCDKQKGFFSQQLIIDCYFLVKVMIVKTDIYTWTSLLQSPFFSFTQEETHDLISKFHSSLEQVFCDTIQHESTYPTAFIETVKLAYSKLLHLNDLVQTESLHRAFCQYCYHPDITQTIASFPHGSYMIEVFESLLFELETSPHYATGTLLDFLHYKLTQYNSAFELPPSTHNAIHIMTIHAAKGLEFDSVCVASCHKKFTLIQSQSTLISDTLVHCNTGSDHDKALRSAYFNEERKAIFNEEYRLFYVACTRAKKTLFLSGLYPSDLLKKPDSYLRFIQSLPEFSTSEQDISFQHSNGSTIRIPCQFQLYPSLPNHTPPHKHDTPAPAYHPCFSTKQVTPSPIPIIQGSTLDISSSFDHTITQDNALYGRLIHTCIQHMLAYQNYTPNAVISTLKNQLNFKIAQPSIQKRCLATIRQLTQSSLLPKLGKTALRFEYDLHFYINGVLCTGRIDAVSWDQSRAHIIEIKTNPCSCLTTLFTRYQHQLTLYCLGLYHRLDVTHIDYSIYSSHLDAIHTKHSSRIDIMAKKEDLVRQLVQRTQ